MSQLDLACEADISTKHLSFVETGRAAPSRDMVMHLAERLDIPLRERNTLLVAALVSLIGAAPSADALAPSHPARDKLAATPDGAAFVCVGERCSLPVTEPEQLAAAIAAMQG